MERQLPKLSVVGSSPIGRSNHADNAELVDVLFKDERMMRVLKGLTLDRIYQRLTE